MTERDELYEQALAIVRQEGRAKVALLQQRLNIGYARAALLLEQLIAAEVLGPPIDAYGNRQTAPSPIGNHQWAMGNSPEVRA
jgi:S-DNA-T family DNA segregation ATPase FtsK/SpoIIIE